MGGAEMNRREAIAAGLAALASAALPAATASLVANPIIAYTFTTEMVIERRTIYYLDGKTQMIHVPMPRLRIEKHELK
jgi:hypothetical protein